MLDTLEIETILQRYTGKEGNFSKIQAAVSALEKRYLLAGYGAVKVLLPAQEIDDGIVDIRIVEGKIGKITVTGAQHFTPENIRASLPMLSEGQQPNMRAIDAALRLANDNPSKGTQLIFRQGSAPGEVDAQLKVVDDSPWRVALLADNSGAPDSNGHYATGRYRTGVLLQHNNLFERDHSATLQYVTSPDHISQVSIFGLGYRIPLYALGDAIERAEHNAICLLIPAMAQSADDLRDRVHAGTADLGIAVGQAIEQGLQSGAHELAAQGLRRATPHIAFRIAQSLAQRRNGALGIEHAQHLDRQFAAAEGRGGGFMPWAHSPRKGATIVPAVQGYACWPLGQVTRAPPAFGAGSAGACRSRPP